MQLYERKWSYTHLPLTSKIYSLFFNSVSCRSSSTNLSYEVNVIPRFNFPAIFLERIIRSDLPVNLRALAYRVERNISGNQKLSLPENHLDKTSSDIYESSAQKINSALCENREYLVSSIPGTLPMPSSEVNINNWGAFGKSCRLDRPCMVDEIHLRRFDGLLVTYLHKIVMCWP